MTQEKANRYLHRRNNDEANALNKGSRRYGEKSTPNTQKPEMATCLLAITLFCAIQSPTFSQTVEYWNTNLGELQLTNNGRGSYSGRFETRFGSKKIYGTRVFRTGKFLGHWTSEAQESPRCDYQVANSYHWGSIDMMFTDNTVTGKFGSCNNETQLAITGSPKMSSSGSSGVDLTGFFIPALEREFNTTHGRLKFKAIHGNYQTGEYGNGYGSIKLTQDFWRPSPRKIYEVNGTFTNKDGGRGEFIFNFTNPCSFTGQWWFAGQSNSKREWNGNCR